MGRSGEIYDIWEEQEFWDRVWHREKIIGRVAQKTISGHIYKLWADNCGGTWLPALLGLVCDGAYTFSWRNLLNSNVNCFLTDVCLSAHCLCVFKVYLYELKHTRQWSAMQFLSVFFFFQAFQCSGSVVFNVPLCYKWQRNIVNVLTHF